MSVAGPETEISEGKRGSTAQLRAIVDCDVHPIVANTALLRPYLSERAARRALGPVGAVHAPPQHGRGIINRLNHPTSALRLDAWPPNGGPPGSDPEFVLEHWLDPNDISAALLIPVQAGIVIPWGDEKAGVEFLGAMNQYFADAWAGIDSRYRLVIAVSPYDIPAAVQEIEKHADTPGVAGIIIPYASVELGRSQYFPLFEVAEHFGLPIVMHQTGGEGNVVTSPRLAGGLPKTWCERHTQLFQPGQAILTSMVFGGVFEAFPRLRLVLVEFGFSWVLPLMWQMDRAWELGDRTLAALPMPPSEYVRRNVRFSTQPIDEPGDANDLREYLGLFPAEELLVFSSDYPHYDNDDPRLVLNTRLPSHMRDRVAFENAIECFGPRIGL